MTEACTGPNNVVSEDVSETRTSGRDRSVVTPVSLWKRWSLSWITFLISTNGVGISVSTVLGTFPTKIEVHYYLTHQRVNLKPTPIPSNVPRVYSLTSSSLLWRRFPSPVVFRLKDFRDRKVSIMKFAFWHGIFGVL